METSIKPVQKFNNGRVATLCNNCYKIIETGVSCKKLFCCKKCEKEYFSKIN